MESTVCDEHSKIEFVKNYRMMRRSGHCCATHLKAKKTAGDRNQRETEVAPMTEEPIYNAGDSMFPTKMSTNTVSSDGWLESREAGNSVSWLSPRLLGELRNGLIKQGCHSS
jgi:hypothetical protein